MIEVLKREIGLPMLRDLNHCVWEAEAYPPDWKRGILMTDK